MDDFPIDDVGFHYNANKNREYRSGVLARFKAFVNFLQDNKLTVRQLLAPAEAPPTTLRIMKSDLTDEGYAFIQNAYDDWLKSKNRGQPMEDTKLLEKRLTSIRQRRKDGE